MSRIISIISGKGGVGKTVTAINLAYALHNNGKDVLLVDGDLSAPDINIYLGAKNLDNSLQNVLSGECHFSDAIHVHASGLKVMPSSMSVDNLKDLKVDKFKDVLFDLQNFSEYVLVDCGAGFLDESIAALEASDDVLIVINPEEASIDVARKAISIAEQLHKTILGVVINKAGEHKHELKDSEIEKVLGYTIVGKIPFDKNVKKSHILNQPVIHTHPKSRSSKKFSKLAKDIF